MKTGIAFLVLSVLLLIAAVVVGIQPKAAGPAGSASGGSLAGGSAEEIPTVVLPPEQLPQFKNISVYTPRKPDPELFINPPDGNQKPTEESKSIKAGIM